MVSSRTVNWIVGAIFVFAAAAIVQMLIPLALEYFGSDWKTVRLSRPARIEGAAR